MSLLSAALLLGMQTAPAAQMVTLIVPSGACRVVVDGRGMSIRQFRSVAKQWRSTQPEIHLQPDPKARYRCVDRVLQGIKDADLTKLGFVGNEQYRVEDLPLQERPQ